MRIDEKILNYIEGAGISFSASIDIPEGCRTISLQAHEVTHFINDKVSFAAKYLGVLVEDYELWLETQGTPVCGAKTQKGRRCKNFVSGGIQMDIHMWRELDRELCAVHGGDSSKEAYKNRKVNRRK